MSFFLYARSGTYPDCSMCGECFDNWAEKIDEVGLTINHEYTQVLNVWSNYSKALPVK